MSSPDWPSLPATPATVNAQAILEALRADAELSGVLTEVRDAELADLVEDAAGLKAPLAAVSLYGETHQLALGTASTLSTLLDVHVLTLPQSKGTGGFARARLVGSVLRVIYAHREILDGAGRQTATGIERLEQVSYTLPLRPNRMLLTTIRVHFVASYNEATREVLV
ncbi:MAG TPA: hypothetical protein VF017_15525 [Thermoanaerobaculia bacterium]|nr:hypothetical protein [Thermoanaerobaculia bacterium]